jgi:hypothetical protein
MLCLTSHLLLQQQQSLEAVRLCQRAGGRGGADGHGPRREAQAAGLLVLPAGQAAKLPDESVGAADVRGLRGGLRVDWFCVISIHVV